MKKLNFLDKNAINPLTTVGGAIAMKTQKLNVIFKSFRGLALAALVVLGASSAFADTYTIEFRDSGAASDGSAKKTTIADVISSGSSYVTSLTSPTNVFQSKTGYGIKLGTSKANGYLTLVLSTSGVVKPTSVTVNAAKYSSDTGKLNVSLNGTAQTPQTVSSSFNDFTFTMDGATDLSSIYIGTSEKRMYIKSVTVTYTSEALPTYTLTWNVNGSTSTTTTVVQGDAIGTLPTDPTSADCDNEKVFVGWTTAPYTNASVAPTYISTTTVPSGNATYYAVFAEGDAGVAVNTVLWAENFAHFNLNTPSAAGTGSGTTIYDNATITYTQSSTNTKAYNEKLAGGTSPELLLAKATPGTWTISGIKTGGATGMSLTFNV